MGHGRPCRSMVSTTPNAIATEVGNPGAGGSRSGATVEADQLVTPTSILVHCSSNHERGLSWPEVRASARRRNPVVSPRRPWAIAAATFSHIAPSFDALDELHPADRHRSTRVAGGDVHHSEDPFGVSSGPVGCVCHLHDVIECASAVLQLLAADQTTRHRAMPRMR